VDNAGIAKPATIIGNTSADSVRLLQLARREARYLAEKINWTALTVENVFVANATSDYTLPADFRSLVGNTLWDRTRFWQMRGAMSPQQWQRYKSSTLGNATIERRWRLRIPTGDPAGAIVKFDIDPVVSTTDHTSTFVYEYVSKNWCRSATLKAATDAAKVAGGISYAVGDTYTVAGGTGTATVLTVMSVSSGAILTAEVTIPGSYPNATVPSNPVSQASTSGIGSGATFNLTLAGAMSPDWAADTDTSILDEDLIELGVIWRVLRRLGMAYDEEKEEYERRLDLAIARDGGTAVLDLARSGVWPMIGYGNIPEGNWPNG
jgi:hypothetical protein